MTDLVPQEQGEFLLFQAEDGSARIRCRFENQSIWLTQATLAELYQVSVTTINEHLKGIYSDREIDPEATIRKFRIVRIEGTREVSRQIEHYELKAILAVGYRVRSDRGTQFRQWATAKLSEFLVKGFVLDDERLKNPPGPGVPDYFDEMLERIRDIRASERRMYLRLREIFALASDYKADEESTQTLFQILQNKLHFAVTGKTAPELIVERASHDKSIFLKDWPVKLDAFLQFNERELLPHAGHVTRESADRKAHQEYARFEERRRAALEDDAEQRWADDLNQAVKKLPGKP
jgi:hypothetical protein